jgi:cytochrome o ubiquinol oxidase operon protein cyoD
MSAEHLDHSGNLDHSGTLREYVTGFLLAVTLTAIPFWLVMSHTFGRSSTTAAVILVLASVQIVVHMVYFLHMNTRSEGGWTLLALLFTVMLVVIALSGSIWVMSHLNDNMMPASMHGMGPMHDMSKIHDMHDMP